MSKLKNLAFAEIVSKNQLLSLYIGLKLFLNPSPSFYNDILNYLTSLPYFVYEIEFFTFYCFVCAKTTYPRPG